MPDERENKYLRRVVSADDGESFVRVDVYAVLEAFGVTCPARQHAVKKLLCAGLRGGKSAAADLSESLAAVRRAIELEAARLACCKHRSSVLAAIAAGLVEGAEPWEGIHDPGQLVEA